MRRVAASRGRHPRRRHPPAVAVRPQPALRLRRAVRLRGRLPPRRTPGRRAGPRPGPAGRAARPGRAARAARPGGARRDRGRRSSAPTPTAGPATPRGSPTCCGWLGPAHHRRGRGPHRRGRRRPPSGWPRWPRAGGPSRSGWRARSAGPRSRTSAGCATRSAYPCRPAYPDAFTEPVDDPLADLVGRYARTHGPFTAADVADPARARRRRGPPDPAAARRRRAGCSRASSGRPGPAPSGATPRCCACCAAGRWPGCGRRSSRSSRPPWAASCSPWQHVNRRPAGRPRGVDGLLQVVDQLAGSPLPASALGVARSSRARVPDYEPALLDELTASGEVIWAGHGRCPAPTAGSRCTSADQAPLTCPLPEPGSRADSGEVHQAVLDALAPGGAWFFRQLAAAGRRHRDARLADALWELVWAGRVTNDTFAPLRALTRARAPTAPAAGRTAAARPSRPGRRRPAPGPPATSGRWSLLPAVDTDPTRRAHATAERLLDRHGVVTRGAVVSRAHRRRVRGGLQGAVRLRGLRALPPRLLRRGPRGRPVRHRRRGRPAAHLRRGSTADDAKPERASRSPRPTRPTRTARPCPGPTASPGGPPPRAQGGRPGRPGRRRAHPLRRARRQDAADLDRRRRPARPGGRSRSPRPAAAARWAG